MGLDHILQLERKFKDCPDCWKNFMWNYDSTTLTWPSILRLEYNAVVYNRENIIVFPNKEEKTRFILTWS